jgi:hypothetical protein
MGATRQSSRRGGASGQVPSRPQHRSVDGEHRRDRPCRFARRIAARSTCRYALWRNGFPVHMPMNAALSSPGDGWLGVDRLGPHDHDVLHTLALVRSATSDQLGRLHFTSVSERACQRTLARLSRHAFVARIARRVGGIAPGSTPWAYALGPAGQRLLGIRGPRGGRVRRPAAPSAHFLRHTLMVTEVYVCAVEVSRGHPITLRRYAVEPECWRQLPNGRLLRPDAELCLAGDGFEDHYFIEADRGTEGPLAISRKLAQYRSYFESGAEQSATGVFPQVLFVTLTEQRRRDITTLIRRVPSDVRPIFAAVALSQLPHVLQLGPDA